MATWLKRRNQLQESSRRARRAPRPPGFERLEDRLVLSFAGPVDYNVGVQTTLGLNGFGPQVITGDFAHNGKLDLAVTNTADGTVNILMGNGNGTFQPAVSYNSGLGAGNAIWMATADFNGDGKLDLAVEGGNSVSLLLGNGDGTFGTAKVYTVGAGVRGGMAVGDFFGNGRQDIAVTVFGNNTVQILPNNGNGTFGTPITLSMPTGDGALRSITTGNIFGNGYADLALAWGEGYNNTLSTTDPAGVGLFKNDGHGHFTYAGQYLAAVTPDPGGGNGQGDTVNPEHINIADLNGDGKPDLVLSLYDHNIDVFINNGNGTFKSAVAYTTETPGSVGGYPRGVAFGDFNGDGKVDIATLNFGEPVPADQGTSEPGSIGILYGNGDGTFQAPIQYTPFLLPGGVAVGDFNGDGLPDLAVAQNYTGHAVGVMLNQPNTAQEPPTVTGISPATGPASGGTLVTITGTNFTGTSQVDFGSVSASFTVKSNTTITAIAPAESAGRVDVTVYNAGASATNSADLFTFTPVTPPPAVTGVSPSVGSTAGGTVVTIIGTNFTGATEVKFGSVPTTKFTVNSATSITATSPPESAGLVDVTVVTPAGTSSDVSVDHFTYQAPILAAITVTPSTASVTDGATQLFSATAFDQFGKALVTQPAFTWAVSGLGTVSNTGLYTAPASGIGTAYVTASSGTVKGYALVTYNPVFTDIWTGLGTTNNWSDPNNWSAKLIPNAGTTVIFNGTSTKSAIVDPGFGSTVAAVQITSVYPGEIFLNRYLIVTGTFTQAGGIYDANGYSTTVDGLTTLYAGTYLASTNLQTLAGGLTLAGGTFMGLTGPVTVANVTLSSGLLNAPSAVLTVTGGNFTRTGGTFNADQGTVVYTGNSVAPTVSVGTGLVKFYNFTDALATTSTLASLTISGTLTVTGTFSWKNSDNAIYGNIEAQGYVDDENHGGIGNPYLTLDGTANQTIEDLSGVGGGQFRTITINKAGGTVALACNPIVFSGLTLTAGTVLTGSTSWYVAGPFSAATGLNLGNIVIDGSNVTVVGTNVQVANIAFAASSDKLTAPTGSLSVSGSWSDSVAGTFIANGGTVVFDGANSTQFLTSGGQSFNNLTILAGSSVELEADAIVVGTFTNLGTLIANGHKILK